jgi:hypothetical protein
MAQQERESFSQLAAEASAAPTAAGVTANGTPSAITPVGSLGNAPAPIATLPAALSSLSLGPNALITRHSSVDLTGEQGHGSRRPQVAVAIAEAAAAGPLRC